MMQNAQTIRATPSTGGESRLAIIAGASLLLSVGVFVASQFGILPSGIGTILVLVGIGILLRLAWTISSGSASSVQHARLAQLMSTVGLIIATLSALAALPRLTKAGGLGLLSVDLAAQLWTVGILFAAAGPAGTLGWRPLTGAFLLGFLGLIALARFIGRPVIVALGTNSLFATSIWAPASEETIKLLPAAFMVFFALRRSDSRPSLLDVVLLTGCGAAGFSLCENAMYGRGAFSLSSVAWVSWLVPGANRGAAYGWTLVQSGHLVHSALIALAVGFTVLYRGRVKRAWIAAAAASAAVLLEHCSQNAIITGGLNRHVGEFCVMITLGGRLCALLLALGLGYVTAIEWRSFKPLLPSREWLQLPAQEANRRQRRLAALQLQEPSS